MLKGEIGSPYNKNLCGVGYLGVGPHKTKYDGVKSVVHIKWRGMVNRCYGNVRRSTVVNARVDEGWHNFQNFAEWWTSNPYRNDSWELDKDILSFGKNTHLYSPETCCIIPRELNTIVSSIGILKPTSGVFRDRYDKYFYNGSGTKSVSFDVVKIDYLENKLSDIMDVYSRFEGAVDPRIEGNLQLVINNQIQKLKENVERG